VAIRGYVRFAMQLHSSNLRLSGRAINKVLGLPLCATRAMMRCRAVQHWLGPDEHIEAHAHG
jgi:hypothetical protein